MTGPGSAVALGPFLAVFGLPDPIYWVPALLLLLGLVGILYVLRPPINDWTPPVFGVWVGIAAVLHVMARQPNFPESLVPLFGTPMLYLTTAVFVALTWTVSEFVVETRAPGASNERQLGSISALILFGLVGVSIWNGILATGDVRPFWPVLGLFAAGTLTPIIWVFVGIGFTEVADSTGKTGVMVVFAHLLDGISTMIGYQVLPERVGQYPVLTRVILDLGDVIPVVGGGGLFVILKLVLAIGAVVVFKRVVDETPRAGRLLLGFVGAVGLGPALHNLILFTVLTSLSAPI
jgi:uncharacterized membrane protein